MALKLRLARPAEPCDDTAVVPYDDPAWDDDSVWTIDRDIDAIDGEDRP